MIKSKLLQRYFAAAASLKGNKMEISVRLASQPDLPEVLALMRALADFEGYSAEFSVNEDDLLHIISNRDDVKIFVADSENQSAIGLAVIFEQPFTFDMQPWFVLKEFYVHKDYRNHQTAKQLFDFVVHYARMKQATRIKWDVLSDNARAKRFYEKMGAEYQAHWQQYSLKIK